MTKDSRKAVFISHANPEDNAFTLWLGARLAAAGYDVWADILRLRGGQDWQRLLEDVLRKKACKVLFVGTEHSVQKQGVRNEIQIACEVGRKIEDPNFIIPLRLSNFDMPFMIAQAQYIDFEGSWADGLAELLETLDQNYHVPTNSSTFESMSRWKQVHLRYARSLKEEPEELISNWLLIESLPEKLYFYNFHKKASRELAKSRMENSPWPIIPLRRGFIAFCPPCDLRNYFEPEFPFGTEGTISTEQWLKEGWADQNIAWFDAHNQFRNLVRQALARTLRQRSLTSYEIAGGHLAWWGKADVFPSGQIKFFWENGPAGRRKITGYSQKREMCWHYGVTPKPDVLPFPHVRIISRVIFSKDGDPVDPKQMHRFRRSFTKAWRNPRWRDMMLAFLHWLSNGKVTMEIPVGAATFLSLTLPPLRLNAPMSVSSVAADEEESEIEDALALDENDAEDIDGFDYAEEFMEGDDHEY